MGMEKENYGEKSELVFDSEDRTGAGDRSDANDQMDLESPMDPGCEEDSTENDDIGKEEGEERSISDGDWEDRVLCEDGNCIGVIGPDGRCKECGRPYKGGGTFSPKEDSDASNFVSADDYDGPGASESETGKSPEYSFSDANDDEFDDTAEKTDSDLEWEQRKLCSDGNCIGVIGPDGLCKECGKPFENSDLGL